MIQKPQHLQKVTLPGVIGADDYVEVAEGDIGFFNVLEIGDLYSV
jgi:hypothetical protein